MKVLLVGFTILLAVALLVFAQQAPPPSVKAKPIEALVTKAAALIDKNGKAAFAEFRKKRQRVVPRGYVLVRLRFESERIRQPSFPTARRN